MIARIPYATVTFLRRGRLGVLLQESRGRRSTLLRCCLVLIAAGAALQTPHAADAPQVRALATVCIPASPDSAEQKALRELTAGWRELFGTALEQTTECRKPCLVLGRGAAVACGAIGDAELAALAPVGFVIRSGPHGLALAGATGPGTVYAVRHLLAQFGARCLDERGRMWFPESPAAGPETFNIVSRPAIDYRNYYSRPLEWADAGKALAGDGITGTDQWIDHSAGYLLPKDLYYDRHPEYYAMLKNGQRIPRDRFTYHRTPLCLSNPDVVRITTERLLKWIGQQPDKVYFPITYGDTGVWCQCPDCLAQDPAPGQYATRLLGWVNALAGAAGKKHPDKLFLTFAYGGSDVAPPKARPAENVRVCCSVSFAALTFWDHDMAAGLGKSSVDKIASWLAVAPEQVTVCEYQGRYYPAIVDTLAGKYRYYAERGIKGIMFSFGHPANFKPVWEYLYPKLLWNPELDAQALAREFVTLRYGAAAPALHDYFALCHARYEATRASGGKLDGMYPQGFYSPEYTAAALACFDRARAAAAADPRLHAEVSGEQRAFIMDWMRHPLADTLTPELEESLRSQCDALARLAGESDEAQIELANRIHRIGLELNADIPGALAVVEAWLKAQDFPKPDVVEPLADGGVRIPAQGFMYDGWNRLYKGHKHPVPPKWGAAVYVKGNSANRSHRMEAVFTLKQAPPDRPAVLELEGQDCDHEVDTAEIRVELNGRAIYEGQALVVKWNWSRQAIPVPAGLLKQGENKLEIFNAADPDSIENWYERWFMLSEAAIRFPADQ